MKRNRERREEMRQEVRSVIRATNREVPIAVYHLASVGHNLNFQSGGSTLMWFGFTWLLKLYQRTNARLWKQGQKSTVAIYHIISRDTIDESFEFERENTDRFY